MCFVSAHPQKQIAANSTDHNGNVTRGPHQVTNLTGTTYWSILIRGVVNDLKD